MKDKEKHKKRGIVLTKEAIAGYLFVLPFVIGFLFFFVKPMGQSLLYSFHKVTIEPGSIVLTPVGLDNYKKALFGDRSFLQALINSVTGALWRVPVIVLFSVFMAMMVNGKFVGRLFFRSSMFLPVIFGTSVVLDLLKTGGGILEGVMETSMMDVDNSYLVLNNTGMQLLQELLANFGFPEELTSKVMGYIDNIFDIAWDSGIQIVLFVIGLQAIPSYIYEVCELEGATKWETFWKITFPLLTPTILLCVVYTIIDIFNSSEGITDAIETNLSSQMHYACAQSWLYSLLICVVLFVIYQVISRRSVYLD
ncbi:MAG: sugar ABC transporter permease [Lachnospiraceae bacterium]|nr:sugar ABC transporter permease [Lachnospiraceae bacterium]